MAPSKDELMNIAAQAEQDLNTSAAKTGGTRVNTDDDAGVNSGVTQKFEGATVAYGSDISTNAGYNKRIPPEEGGDLDDKGRQTRGSHFEGSDQGPRGDIERRRRDAGGENDADLATNEGPGHRLDGQDQIKGQLEEGAGAIRSNVGDSAPGRGGSNFKGGDYAPTEDVPGSVADQGLEPPASVIETSKNVEGVGNQG